MPRKAKRRRGGGGRGGDGAHGDGEDVAGDGDDVGGQGGGRGAVNRGRGGARGGGRGHGGVGNGEAIRGRGRAGGGRGEADRGRGRAGGVRGGMNGGLAGGRGRGGADGDEGNHRSWYEPVEQDQHQGGGGEGGGGEEHAAHEEAIEEEDAAYEEAIEEDVAAPQGGEEEDTAHQQEDAAHQEGEEEDAAHQQEDAAHQEGGEEAAGLDLQQLRKDCLKAEEFIADLKRWRRPPKQINVATDPWKNVATDLKEFTLDWENPRGALRQFYVESREYFRYTYPFLIIPGMRQDGSLTEIPMALEMETDFEDRRYHIANLKMATEKAIGQLLVIEYSGYCAAFRILYEGDDPKLIPWCVHGDHRLPDRFKPWHNIRYSSSYSSVANVKVEEGINYQIFSFLESFRNKALDVESEQFLEDKSHLQRGTNLGRFLFDTLYVLIAEGRRFIEIARWNLRFLGPIPDRFVDLILHWLKSSRCIFYLYLYLLEEGFSKYLLENGVAMSIEGTRAKVIKKWEKANLKLGRSLLYKLSGQQLVLLKNAPDVFDAILMRRAGYPGPLMKKIAKMSRLVFMACCGCYVGEVLVMELIACNCWFLTCLDFLFVMLPW